MIYESCPALGKKQFIRSLQAFFRSVWYQALVVLLMAVSNVFALELPVFYIYLFLGLAVMLFAEDTLPLVPIFLCCYMTIAPENNPATHVETTVFKDPAFKVQFMAILGVAAVAIAARLVYSVAFSPSKGERRGSPALSLGFLALGVSYVLGGLFSPYYAAKTALFGLVQIASLCAFYYFFYFTVDFKRAEKDYLLRYFLFLGFGIILETVRLYFLPGVFTPDGVDRGKLTTGWGMYNNIGCIVAMCIPAGFYFALTHQKGWRYTLLACLTFGGVILTQSRGSILFGGIVFAISYIYVVTKSKGRERLGHLVVGGAVILIVMVLFAVFFEKFMKLFASMIRFDSNGRDKIWKDGLAQFAEHPLFGVGFYECGALRWGNLPSDSFLPPRYHDTYLQLLASGGIVALLCYAFHRFQTVRLFFKNKTRENMFLGLVVLALILTSFTDCHFFNFGPGLLYSVVLVFIERIPKAEKPEPTPEQTN